MENQQVAPNEPVESTPQEEILEDINQEVEEEIESEEQAEAPKLSRRDKRINQLSWEKHELERQKNAEIEELKRQLSEKQAAPPTTASEGRPTKADFDYDEDRYIEAISEWKAKQALEKFAKEQEQKAANLKQQEIVQTWQQKAQAYASENPDYISLTKERGNAVSSQAVAAFLTSSENGVKLHHELLDNFPLLQRIQALPDWQQGAELVKLESELANKTKTKKQSKAPQPVVPIKKTTAISATGGSIFPTNW